MSIDLYSINSHFILRLASFNMIFANSENTDESILVKIANI